MTGSTQLGRWRWNAERFGLTPAKILSRFGHRQGPSIVSNSLPKAGTHLLEQALCCHPRIYRPPVRTLHKRSIGEGVDLSSHVDKLGPNQLLITHLEYTPERAVALGRPQVRSFFMIRDPRDIVVSQAHFIAGRKQHAHHRAFADLEALTDRMELVIRGSERHGIAPIRHRLDAYAPWLSSTSLVVRYEDLVGSGGGGEADRQMTTLEGIFDHLGLVVETHELRDIAARTFSSTSPTFRRGTTAQWRRHFDDSTSELFEGEVGDVATRFGYPLRESNTPGGEGTDATR